MAKKVGAKKNFSLSSQNCPPPHFQNRGAAHVHVHMDLIRLRQHVDLTSNCDAHGFQISPPIDLLLVFLVCLRRREVGSLSWTTATANVRFARGHRYTQLRGKLTGWQKLLYMHMF